MTTDKTSLQTGEKQGKKREVSQAQLDRLKPTQFKPGQSGNPTGRPKTGLLSVAMREKLAEVDPKDKQGRTFAEIIAERLIKDARAGKVQATSELADRTEGRPKQAHELSGPGGGPIPFTSFSPEENEERIRQLEAAARGETQSQVEPK